MWEAPCLHCLLLLHSTIILPEFKSHASMIKRENEVLALNRHRIIPPTDSVEDVCVAAESLFASTIRTLEKDSSLCQDLAAEEKAAHLFPTS